MLRRNLDAPLRVEIPSLAADTPSWTKVGVIAVVGFVAGVTWPRLAGIRLGPSLPESAPASASASPSAPANPPQAAVMVTASQVPAQPALPPAAAPSVAVAAPATPPGGEVHAGGDVHAGGEVHAQPGTLSVSHGIVFSCRTAAGDNLKGSDCGTLPGLDRVALPRLKKLAECPQAAGATGKLHLILRPDFGKGTLVVDLSHVQTVSSPDGLLACAKSALADVKLDEVTHENARYGVSYAVDFGEPGSAARDSSHRSRSSPSSAPPASVSNGAVRARP